MRIKILSILLCVVMVMVVLSGCGSNSSESASEQTTANEQTTKAEDTQKSATTETKSTEKKKIVVVMEREDDPTRIEIEKNILSTLEKGGYINGQTAEITEIKMAGDEKKSPEVVEKIKGLKPDVVIGNAGQFLFKSVAKPLEGSGIPFILNLNVENAALDFIDKDGKPKNNITGLYTMPLTLKRNAFDMLNKVSPLNGKKAVFITVEGRINKQEIVDALNELKIPLKDYVEVKYVEEYQDAFTKYHNDAEVGWVLVGVWPGTKKDGTLGVQIECAKWDMANRKKPAVTFWESACKMGIPCALGVDLPGTGTQAAEMAIKILKGEKVENLKAESPKKTSIVLNQKTAKTLGIVFPADILGSASKVYDETINDPKK